MQFPIGYMGVGATLDTAILVFKQNVRQLATIVAVTLIPVRLIAGVGTLVMLPDLQSGNPQAFQAHPEIMFLGLGILVILSLLVMPLIAGSTLHGINAIYLGRPTNLSDCYLHALRRWFPLVVTNLLMYLVIAGGWIMCVIPGLILLFWFLVAPQVVVLENRSGPNALLRSKDLMRGEMGKAFALTLLVSSINSSVGSISVFIPQQYAQLLIQAVIACFLTAFASCAMTVFYYSCRCKLDHFDLQMLVEAVEHD